MINHLNQMQYTGKVNEHLSIALINNDNCHLLKSSKESELTLLWFQDNDNRFRIDNAEFTFGSQQIVCFTEFHKIEVLSISSARMIRFNRSFYCIIDHDSEVGCKGILFFGASQLPVIDIPQEEVNILETVFEMFSLELRTRDNLQLEMLQMMLKRFLILCTRLYKKQQELNLIDNEQINIIREYNFLVEQHFRTKHTVSEYAEMLFKSSKTLSNIFSRISERSPLQYIHDRKMLEARRLLKYTDISIKEIAYEIGFEDAQSFGRFFKNLEGLSPSAYRKSK